ncbi:MAG: Exonuclease SbcC [Labilithrix sp.]|nr:Exonuclease SbcC [Labilithrix sp.]
MAGDPNEEPAEVGDAGDEFLSIAPDAPDEIGDEDVATSAPPPRPPAVPPVPRVPQAPPLPSFGRKGEARPPPPLPRVDAAEDLVVADEHVDLEHEDEPPAPEAQPRVRAKPQAELEDDGVERPHAPGPIPGASQLPPAPVEAIEAMAAAVSRLRDEAAASGDRPRRARLLDEAGEIQERGGDEPGAARDYLAAYNADTSFREPLEGLVRLLERRRSLENLGKLVEALVASAVTPEERARALTERAIFFEDVQADLEGARGAAREATETGAGPSDLGAAWLTLELVAAKLADPALREEALAGRAELPMSTAWRQLLLVDVAALAASSGDIDRALTVAARARDEGGPGTWAATGLLERITRSEPGLPGSDEARARGLVHAATLEHRAEATCRAIVNDAHDARDAQGDAIGVPRHVRTTAHAVHLLLLAASARRAAGDLPGAASALDRALEVIAEVSPQREDEPTSGGAPSEGSVAIERLLLTARMRLAEATGDTARAADLASRRMVGETDGGVVAALSLRVAEHAASEGDVPRALEALARATERDPVSAPARALEIDLLDGAGNPARFAEELEELSRHYGSGEAQGRALLLAAYVWAARASNAERAREALGQAEACGTPKELVARLGRSLASLRGDDAWYEAATRSLLEEKPAGELPMLWIELARLRLAAGDEVGAGKATAQLRDLAEGAWLGRVLDGLTGGESADPDADEESKARARARSRTAIEELAASAADPDLRRTLRIMGAMRAHAAGDRAAAVAHLRALAEEDGGDPLVTAYLSDLLRSDGDRAGAGELARTLAEASEDDPDLRAARFLEAGLERWRAGDRPAGFAMFESAGGASAAPVVAWAARGVEVDALEGRRRALELGGADASVALERFALESTAGDPDDAEGALAAVDIATTSSLRLAGALARIVWPRGAADPDALGAALETLSSAAAAAGGTEEGAITSTRTIAAAERLRVAREAEDGARPDDVMAAAHELLDVGGGAAAALEWLAAAMSSGDAAHELPARRALAELVSDEAREAMQASATLLEALVTPDVTLAPIAGTSHAARLANLELAAPGSEPARRAAALGELDGALGEAAEMDALALAGWSRLAAGDAASALEGFRTVTAARPDDLQAWEGLRVAAEQLRDREAYAVACEQLGGRSSSPARGAAFWEQAALSWGKLGEAFDDRVEAALDASFARDPSRLSAFDRLFRRVRERKDGAKLLDLVGRRLEYTDDAAEIAKLYWEMARVLREKGDPDAALEALDHVVMFDENHVGALALTGEIFIRRGMFAEAAEKLARLATVAAAPPKNRITAGVAAVDLYENKLGRHDLALQVLLALHDARLTTLPVRERLARAAARTGSWSEATRILEELMNERAERDGRVEAARLALAIHRDRLHHPAGALAAATKLLAELPGDGEALDLVVGLEPSAPARRTLLEQGRDAILMTLHEAPASLDVQRRLARVAHALGDANLEQSALSCAVALGGPDGSSEQMLTLLGSKKPRVPQVPLTEPMLRQVLAPGDEGPIADLFAALGPTLAEALGPSLTALGVHPKKDRIDPRAGLALRNEIAAWAGALGIASFDLYVGGKDAGGVQGIPGDTPAIVVGSGVNAPLSPTTRARVARELLAIARGTTVTRWRDDATIAAIVVAACNLVKVPVSHPPYAVLAEVERLVGKAIGRRAKAAILPICKAYVGSGQDARQWAARARASQGRIATVASGDVAVVLADVFGEPVERLGAAARDDLRAHELLRFVLSRPYFDLRRALGLEG